MRPPQPHSASSPPPPGSAGSPPFSFQLAATPHFSTRDQASIGTAPYVRALGLGAKNTLDYSVDPRAPRLSWVDNDYLRFGARAAR